MDDEDYGRARDHEPKTLLTPYVMPHGLRVLRDFVSVLTPSRGDPLLLTVIYSLKTYATSQCKEALLCMLSGEDVDGLLSGHPWACMDTA